jgi:hypothetical protein
MLGRKVVALAGTLMLTATFAMADEIPDGEGGGNTSAAGKLELTVRQDIHACPQNHFMSGVQADENRFLCTSYSPGYNPATDEHQDPAPGQSETVEQGMHACPKGSVMSGLQVDRNVFLCVPSPLDPKGDDTNVVRVIDEDTERGDMHACPIGLAIAGIDIDRNLLLCETHQ